MTDIAEDVAARSHRAETELLTYLHLVAGVSRRPESKGWLHPSQYHLMLAFGRFHEPARLPPEVRRRAPKECYPNAGTTAAKHDGLLYVEGIAMLALGDQFAPIEHGWCVTAAGAVVDPTWADGEGAAYFGIAVADRAMWPLQTGWHILPKAFDLMQGGPPRGTFAAIGRPTPDSKET